jgi:hypothetical protein
MSGVPSWIFTETVSASPGSSPRTSADK